MFCFSQCYTNARITGERLKRANFFLYYYYSLKEKNHAYLSQGCPGWKNRQEPQIPDQTLFHTMPPEWKEPRPGRDSPLSGTSPDVCGQTGLASQDVRAANCCSRYWVFTHSRPGCFALQVIKQGNGAAVYESDPCAAAPRFRTSTSAPAAPSIGRAFYCFSCLSRHQALKQILLEISAAVPSLPHPQPTKG